MSLKQSKPVDHIYRRLEGVIVEISATSLDRCNLYSVHTVDCMWVI